ncbi:hypothetical protein CF319_g3043 [Tilletia indica]|nr:hypothetical protein CF319_g3043 [Tilletia indica]
MEDPTPTADTLIPQLTHLQDILTHLVPSSGSTTLPSYEDLIATIESATSKDDNSLTPRLHAARLNASLAYFILDSLWILMKTSGINIPSHHPLLIQLERARSYIDKVKRISPSSSDDKNAQREPDLILAAQQGPQRRVDAGPAGRFIKAALASQSKGTLTKFADDDDDEPVAVAVEEDAGAVEGDDAGAQVQLGKRKSPEDRATVKDASALTEDPRKKKRAAVDPYTDYDVASPAQRPAKATADAEDDDEEDGEDDDAADTTAQSTASDAKKKGKKRRKSKKAKSKSK